MNKTTYAIRKKGYSLAEFCEHYCICLRTYRTYEVEQKARLEKMIEELPSKEGK